MSDEAQLYQEIYDRASKELSGESPLSEVLVTETSQTVFNRPGNWKDVRKYVKRLPKFPLLALISNITILLERGRHPVDAVAQYRITEGLSSAVSHERRVKGLLRRLREEPPRIVVHEQQLAILARLAILESSAEAWPVDGNELVLRAFLALNDIPHQEVSSVATSVEEQVLFTEIRASGVSTENMAKVFRRYGDFFQWARTSEAKESRHWLDIDDLMLQSTSGLSYNEFAAAMFAFYSHFGQISVSSDNTASYYPLLNVDDFLNPVVDSSVLRQWLNLVSIPLSTASEELRKIPQSSCIASLEPLMNTPLVRIGNTVYCPALRYLPNAAGNGLLFRLGDQARRLYGERGWEQFRGLFAMFLESHVVRLVQEATLNRSVLMFRERCMGGNEGLSSDVVVIDSEDAIFIDVNSKRLNTRRSVVELNRKSIERDLRKMLVEKLNKLAKRARQFKAGDFRLDGVDVSKITRITAIVITPQDLPRIVGIPLKLRELLPTLPSGIDQWDFFDLNEVELLPEMYGGTLDLASLISAKRNDPICKDRSLTNFLWYRDRQRLAWRGTRDEALADPWFKEILATAVSWGLPSPRQSA